jgi:hypothetical protein
VTLLGLTGYAGSGKDTLAAEIIRHHPEFRRVAFADKLRDLAMRLNPALPTQPLADTVGRLGWEDAKNRDDYVRQYLQRLGVACRDVLGEDVWVNAALPPVTAFDPYFTYGGPDIVVTDVRFPNEAVAVKDRGGLVIRIEREGVGPVNGHTSETAMDMWAADATVQNDGTEWDMLGQLYRAGILDRP